MGTRWRSQEELDAAAARRTYRGTTGRPRGSGKTTSRAARVRELVAQGMTANAAAAAVGVSRQAAYQALRVRGTR